MENCPCGEERKQYWLWSDTNGGTHASRFVPTSSIIRSVLAVTSRDALLSATDGRTSRHRVTDADDPNVWWEGRCSEMSLAG